MPKQMAASMRAKATQWCRVYTLAALSALAILDQFKPCVGTVDGINFANFRRWMRYMHSRSVRSPRSPLFAKLSRGRAAEHGPVGGRFERNKFRKFTYAIFVSTLHVMGERGHASARAMSCATACVC